VLILSLEHFALQLDLGPVDEALATLLRQANHVKTIVIFLN